MASSAPRSSRDRPAAPEAVAAALERFVAERLPAALPRQRWFGSQGRRVVAVRLRDLAPLGARAPGAWWSLVDVEFERGADETYALPLLVCGDTRAPGGALGHLEVEGVPGLVADALAVLHPCASNCGDGWRWALGRLAELRKFFATRGRHGPLELGRLGELVRDFSAGTVAGLGLLGALTGALHAGLAEAPDDLAFAAEPISSGDVARWTGRIASDLGLTLEMLRASLPTLPTPARGRGQALLAAEPALRASLAGLAPLAVEGCCQIRVRGDYHLGQTLRTDDGFVILDFEGEPVRPPEERRAKQCALKDVAGMLRSFDYAVATALGDEGAASAVGDTWRRLAVEAFLDGYLPAAAKAPVRLGPRARPTLHRALAVFELDKAL